MEIAVFTKEIAEGLMDRGFELMGKSRLAWFFKDDIEVCNAINYLLENSENSIDNWKIL